MHRQRRAPWALFPAMLLSTALAASGQGPVLVLDGGFQAPSGQPITVPVAFFDNGHTITSMVFSLDIDAERLAFDPSDLDLDGLPDAISLPAGAPALTVIDYDMADADGELDVLFANLSGAPLPEGVLLEIQLTMLEAGIVAHGIGFSADPPVSFGDDLGQDVPGSAVVLGLEILFVDGFESGDVSAWSDTEP